MPDQSWDAFFANAEPEKEETGGGLWSSFWGMYDKLNESFLPSEESVNAKEDEYASKLGTVGRGLQKFNQGYRAVTRPILDATVGSPLALAGSAATFASGGIAQVPKIVNTGARLLDAVQAVDSGRKAYANVQSGNTLGAAGNIVGAGLASAGAIVPPARANVRVPQTDVVPSPVYRSVAREADKDIVRASYGPQVRSAVIPEERQLPQTNTSMIKGRKDSVGSRVPKPTDSLFERATREFDALELPVNQRNLLRYRNDDAFRARVQAEASKRGAGQDYSPTNPTRQVLAAPEPDMQMRPVTSERIREDLINRGIANPSDAMVARIRKNPELQGKMGLVESEMRGVENPRVKGLLGMGDEDSFARIERIRKESGVQPDDAPEIKIDKIGKVVDDPDAKSIITLAQNNMKRQGNALSYFARGLGTSMERELETIGPVGKSISNLLKTASTDSPIRFNSYIKDVRSDVEALDAKEFEKVVDYLEGNLKDAPSNIQTLGDKLKNVLSVTGRDLEDTGLLEKGSRKVYWPHRYENVPEQTLRESMKSAGMSEDQITANLKRIQENRELKGSFEYTRNDLNVPGYRKDKDVLIDHLRDVSKRVENARAFGAKDVLDPNSPISKLIEQSEDPGRVRDLVTRAIRGDAPGSETGIKVAQAVRKYATATQLSLASISNYGGMLPILVRSTTQDALAGIPRAFNTDLPDMQFMENTNLFRKFSGGFAETIGDSSKLYKVFGIEGSQNLLNRYAGAVGNGHAQSLFGALKEGSTSKRVLEQLEDLTLTPIAQLSKQESLTEKQLERAMVRMAEITQGVTENRKLPYMWNHQGIATIPQIFMRTSFQTSKALFDAVKQDKLRASAKLAVGGLLIGEVIGDTKEFVKSVAQVGMNSAQQRLGITTEDKNLKDEYLNNIGLKDGDEQDRFSFTRSSLAKIHPELGKSEVLVRGIGNLEQSFALGMPADILRTLGEAVSSPDKDKLSKAMSLFWAWDEGNKVFGTGVNAATGNFRDVGREALKRTPFIGSGASREVETTRQVERGTGKKKKKKQFVV